ncbi:DUF2851 family protein [Candidatus Sulfidibacterium hydrothermale]|uniref:DUF2851 family protein n=1 Tax=Candidatus Sulfidibacterium hydrothermale TaxID=2875962 RepID=UPI001F0B0CE5|nr:DUF2851 family protein [Candidatus Sulfidibacterium hydrothermale]UBM61444.1 DUF2851 family protein [Candidatus Sulfidibacterium hydrothermale]
MNEEFLYYLWQYHFQGKCLNGTQNETFCILHPGQRNTNSGPDFFNARIKIGTTLWAGNVEIHVRSSDWYKHGHQHDHQYDNVILHVVYTDDHPVVRRNGERLPTLVLKEKFDEKLFHTYRNFLASKRWIPCENLITRAGHFHITNWLYRLAIERLERKAREMERLLASEKNDFREMFYQKLLENYGFQINNQAFAQLARRLPYSVLAKHKNHLLQIEALLFGQAGMLNQPFSDNYPHQLQQEYRFLSKKYNLTALDPGIWRFMRTHPSNFPTLRIAQFAGLFYRSTSLLQKMLESKQLTDVINLLQTQASVYWKTHYQWEKSSPLHSTKMGKTSIFILLINTIIPFLFVYSRQMEQPELSEKALNWLAQLPAEKNRITRHFSALGLIPDNALQSQALLRLKKYYCNPKQCLHCSIGHQLLKSL